MSKGLKFKERLIKALEKEKDGYQWSTDSFLMGAGWGTVNAIDIAKNLPEEEEDEEELLTVPQCVAEWFEEYKDGLDNAIFGYIMSWEDRDTESAFYQWFTKSKNKPIETLVSMKAGYRVEKPTKWRVYDPTSDKDLRKYLARVCGVEELRPIWRHVGEEHPVKFDSLEKANAAAALFGGLVEEVK